MLCGRVGRGVGPFQRLLPKPFGDEQVLAELQACEFANETLDEPHSFIEYYISQNRPSRGQRSFLEAIESVFTSNPIGIVVVNVIVIAGRVPQRGWEQMLDDEPAIDKDTVD